MATNMHHVAEQIFNLLKGYGYLVKSYDKDGKLVVNPQEATRFLVDDPNILVRLDQSKMMISLATSEDLTDHPLRKNLKNLTFDAGPSFSFDYRVFGKKIKAKGEKLDIAKNSEKDMADVMEGTAKMTGTARTSYQPLDNVKIIVKHRAPVNEQSKGARSRNIHSIYIKRGSDRFKMQENSLSAARAMARHLNNGGEIDDSVGARITEMSSEYVKLQQFVKYVQKSNLINEQNQQYVTTAMENIHHIRDMFKKLSMVGAYASAAESLQQFNDAEILVDDVDLQSQFIEQHFDARVTNAVDSIKRAMSRQRAYEQAIETAIQQETFENLKNLLQENDVLDFATPHAKLGHQVAQMGQSAQDPRLSTCLADISKKLYAGGSMNQFEYTTVKSCLLSANEAKLKESVNKRPVEVEIKKLAILPSSYGKSSTVYELYVNGEYITTYTDIRAAEAEKKRLISQPTAKNKISMDEHNYIKFLESFDIL
jgi:hypothetical protein